MTARVIIIGGVEAVLWMIGEGGDYEVQLKSGKRLSVSRSRREAIEQRFGVTS